MKIKSTLFHAGNPIAECEWELDDRARTAQQALAALSIEDHLRGQLNIEHKIVVDEPKEEESKKNESESESVDAESETTDDYVESSDTPEDGQSCDCPIQGTEDRELNGVDSEAEVNEGTSGRDIIPHPSLRSESDD